jgi:dTMP kinase
MRIRGSLIAIEGGDGSGKATQTALTRSYAESLNVPVYTTSFPRYNKESAIYVEKLLNGAYGEDVNALPPEVAAVLFAVDRMAGTQEIDLWLNSNPTGVAILDRYRASNLAHQGAKIADKAIRIAFYEQLQSYETNVLGILSPDINIILNVPPKIAQQNVDTKDESARTYTERTRDIHESDAEYLEKVKACYAELADLYPDQYIAIDCVNSSTGIMRTKDEIQMEIQSIISKNLTNFQ